MGWLARTAPLLVSTSAVALLLVGVAKKLVRVTRRVVRALVRGIPVESLVLISTVTVVDIVAVIAVGTSVVGPLYLDRWFVLFGGRLRRRTPGDLVKPKFKRLLFHKVAEKVKDEVKHLPLCCLGMSVRLMFLNPFFQLFYNFVRHHVPYLPYNGAMIQFVSFSVLFCDLVKSGQFGSAPDGPFTASFRAAIAFPKFPDLIDPFVDKIGRIPVRQSQFGPHLLEVSQPEDKSLSGPLEACLAQHRCTLFPRVLHRVGVLQKFCFERVIVEIVPRSDPIKCWRLEVS